MGVNDRSEQQMAMLDAILVELQGLRADLQARDDRDEEDYKRDQCTPERVTLELADGAELAGYVRRQIRNVELSRNLSQMQLSVRGLSSAYIGITPNAAYAKAARYAAEHGERLEKERIIRRIDGILDRHYSQTSPSPWQNWMEQIRENHARLAPPVNPFTMKRGGHV